MRLAFPILFTIMLAPLVLVTGFRATMAWEYNDEVTAVVEAWAAVALSLALAYVWSV